MMTTFWSEPPTQGGVLRKVLGKNAKADKLDINGDSAENTVTFTSADKANPSAYTDVSIITSGETHKSLLNKISIMFKNVRFLFKALGTTDISNLGNGTVTSALSELDSILSPIEKYGLYYQKVLTASDNLNNITTSGIYYAPTGDTPINSPYENAAVYIVLNLASTTTRVIQIAIRYGSAGYMSFRTLSAGSWLDWRPVATVYNNRIADLAYLYSEGGTAYKPCFEAGDSVSMTINTAGFLTSSSTSVRFSIPIPRRVIGSPTITITTSGMTLRQGGNYTHGSSASVYATPDTITASTNFSCLNVIATFSNTTNAINNDTIGIAGTFTVTFS